MFVLPPGGRFHFLRFRGQVEAEGSKRGRNRRPEVRLRVRLNKTKIHIQTRLHPDGVCRYLNECWGERGRTVVISWIIYDVKTWTEVRGEHEVVLVVLIQLSESALDCQIFPLMWYWVSCLSPVWLFQFFCSCLFCVCVCVLPAVNFLLDVGVFALLDFY